LRQRNFSLVVPVVLWKNPCFLAIRVDHREEPRKSSMIPWLNCSLDEESLHQRNAD